MKQKQKHVKAMKAYVIEQKHKDHKNASEELENFIAAVNEKT